MDAAHDALDARWPVRHPARVSLLRFLGLAGTVAASSESETIRRIAERLEALEANEALRVAAFAFVLARVANVDLHVSDAEIDRMSRSVADEAGIDLASAARVIEIARTHARQLGGTANYTVTREFRRLSTRDDRLRLLRCLFAVAAAENAISSAESAEIVSIGEEIGFTREDVIALRLEWREQIAALRARA